MIFFNNFLFHCIFAALFSLLFFGIPGMVSAKLLGLSKRSNFSLVLLSPALGLCTFGPFSLLFTWVLGYNVPNIVIAWLTFVGISFFSLSKTKVTASKFLLIEGGNHWLVLGAMLWALIPATNIYPVLFEQGLFVNGHIYDHMKIAIIKSITREGLPVLNPFYAPLGERIPLIYYYAWHFDASLVKLLTGVSAWQADIALTWFTSFATVLLLAALAIRITQKRITGYYVLLLALMGPYFNILSAILGFRWNKLVNHPDTHELEVLWVQLSWAPQHVFSALTSVVLIFLTSHALHNKSFRWQHAWLIGLTAAAGFGSSIWVGGIALLCIIPFVLLMLKISDTDCSKMFTPLLSALLICIVFSFPILTAITSGPAGVEGLPLTIKVFLSSLLTESNSFPQKVIHIFLYWWQFLPLSFGIVYILGLLAVLRYRPKNSEIRLFFILSVVVILGDLLFIQFIQSNIANNDFGWRTVLIPAMLLIIWGSVTLTELSDTTNRCSLLVISPRGKHIFTALAWIGITLGMASTIVLLRWPEPVRQSGAPDQAFNELHQDFLKLSMAWQAINKHTGKSDLVQSNPDSPYNTVITPWSAPASLALLGNRATAYSEPESATVFAFSYSEKQRQAHHLAVKAIFLPQPTLEALLYARDTLNIKALLVDHHDPCWASQAFEKSGLFSLVESHPTYKIYRAK